MLSSSAQQTRLAAREVWRQVRDNFGKDAIIIALEGELGSGKTVFSKGLFEELKITEDAVSPTFVLHITYTIPNKEVNLEHIDVWRMEDVEELRQLKLRVMVDQKAVIVIEWADKFRDEINSLAQDATVVWVKFKYGKGETEREITWEVV